MNMSDTLKEVIKTEMDAIGKMLEEAGEKYDKVLELFYNCKGKIIFMGIGKSGHIGKKLAATFASTGTPSFFVHASEAVHGDLGMIEKQDIAVLISNSGNTAEVVQDIPGLKAIGCATVAFTSGANSELVKQCDHAILYPKIAEADHLNLAPTVSSTLTLVLGDAIACALSKKRGFARDNFYQFHPAGALGRMLKEEKDIR